MNTTTKIQNQTPEEFISNYQKLIWFIITKQIDLSSTTLEPSDIFNEIILHLFREDFKVLRSYKKKAKFSTWLYTVVRFKVLDMVKKNTKEEKLLIRPDGQIVDDGENLWNLIADTSQDQEDDIDNHIKQILLVRKSISMLNSDRKAFITDLIYNKLSTEKMMDKYQLNSNNSVFSRKSKIIDELSSIVKKIEVKNVTY